MYLVYNITIEAIGYKSGTRIPAIVVEETSSLVHTYFLAWAQHYHVYKQKLIERVHDVSSYSTAIVPNVHSALLRNWQGAALFVGISTCTRLSTIEENE